MKFFEAVTNIFKIPDLRKRILFTLAMLAIYRLGGHIPTPGIDANRLQAFFQQNQGTLFGFIDLFSGGMLRRLTIFALGIMPYITASIILQLMTVVVPTLEKLQKEGELGRRKITQWTRYLTVILALIQSFGIAVGLMKSEGGFVLHPGPGFVIMTMLSLTTGTAFIMWLGEQITERGIGNGMSLIIFTGIVVGIPNAMNNIYQHVFQLKDWTPIHLIVILAVMIAVVAFIVLVERGERRIPVQYAKRVVGRRMMGGQSTHLPLKVNAGGVIPVIFASSLLAFPQTLLNIPALQDNRSSFCQALSEAKTETRSQLFTMYLATHKEALGRRLTPEELIEDLKWAATCATDKTFDPVDWRGQGTKGFAYWVRATLNSIGGAQPLYYVLFTVLIIFFCFFYVSIIFNPNEAADNMRKYGGFIPGIRPGKNTAEYMNKILTKITVVGGLYLSILSIIPTIMIQGIKLQRLPLIGNFIDTYFPRWLLDGLNVNFFFGGTSLLIVVGVAMDTVNQVEAQLIMRHYEGFTPRSGRIRGRRTGT